MTTLVSLRKGDEVVIAADRQATVGHLIEKGKNAGTGVAKIRKLYNGKVLVGIAGRTSHAMILLELLEGKVEKYQGHLRRAVTEMMKDWLTEKRFYNLEAVLLVVSKDESFKIVEGDVIDPEGKHKLMAVGSGGEIALGAASYAVLDENNLESASDIARKAAYLGGYHDVYSNTDVIVESISITG